ncbi:MAG: aspartyl protease family protein [Erythrobacter cryptus]
MIRPARPALTRPLALGLAALAAAPLAAQAPVPAEAALPSAAASLVDPAAEVLALEQERHRRLTLPVTVEGAGPFAFLIDTGSQATAVTHELSARLGLAPAGRATLVGMASRRQVDLVRIGALGVGSSSLTDLVAPVLEGAHVGADGILGLDALQDHRVLIDFRARTIALDDARGRAQGDGGFEIVVRARQRHGQLLITNALVEGVRATVIIDTGAQASLGNTALRERIRARRAQDVITTDVNGVDLIGELALVRSLSIEGLTINDVALTFADTPAFAALGLADRPVLSLGMQHLALFERVGIDFARQRILFDVPRDIAAAIRAARRAGYRP